MRPIAQRSPCEAPCRPACPFNRLGPDVHLYYAPHTCALASHIALEDAGAPYALKRVDFRKTEQQSADYPRRIPRVMEHRARMAERPSVKKAIAEELSE